MTEIFLIPLEGAIVNNAKILFQLPKEEIVNLIGEPNEIIDNQYFYNDLDFRLDFDDNNQLEFMECQGPYSETSDFKLYDINPFALSDDELIQLLNEKNNGEVDDFEAPNSYSFMEVSVGIWRASSPSDIEDTIAEMKKNNEYNNSEAIMLQELEKSRHFWSIGIGRENYYK